MVVYNLADMFFIAMLGDDTQVAAVAVVGPVFSVANAVATTIGAGGCTLIARALGAGEREKASSLASLCVWTALGFGLVFAALLFSSLPLFFCFSPPLPCISSARRKIC